MIDKQLFAKAAKHFEEVKNKKQKLLLRIIKVIKNVLNMIFP